MPGSYILTFTLPPEALLTVSAKNNGEEPKPVRWVPNHTGSLSNTLSSATAVVATLIDSNATVPRLTSDLIFIELSPLIIK